MDALAQEAQEPGRTPGGDEQPRWPAWYAGVGFVVGLIATLVAVGIVAAITGADSQDQSPGFTIFATVLQSASFVGTAVLFASFVAPPRAWQFGLRQTPLRQAAGWAALGMLSYFVLTAVYSALVHPDAKQSVTHDLGADQGTVGLIAAGAMILVVAPAAEEFFFRGFFYRALRSRYPVLGAAAIDGILFGAIHFDFSGAGALLFVPPLALLGFIFCLVYERTGSIFPTIALHSLNNSIAYAASVHDGWAVSVVLGPLMIAACAGVPRLIDAGPRPAPV